MKWEVLLGRCEGGGYEDVSEVELVHTGQGGYHWSGAVGMRTRTGP